MSKTKISFALITIVLILVHPLTAGAEDLLDRTVVASLQLSFRSVEIPMQIPAEQWQWVEASPVRETSVADTSDDWPGQVPGRTHFLRALLPASILDSSGKGNSLFMHDSEEHLLKGEPEDTSFVLGFRYSFSEFDLCRFCKSLFTLIARGNTPTAREGSGFAFFVDSPSR